MPVLLLRPSFHCGPRPGVCVDRRVGSSPHTGRIVCMKGIGPAPCPLLTRTACADPREAGASLEKASKSTISPSERITQHGLAAELWCVLPRCPGRGLHSPAVASRPKARAAVRKRGAVAGASLVQSRFHSAPATKRRLPPNPLLVLAESNSLPLRI